MASLRPLPYRKVRKALRALGFSETRQRGSHVWFAHPDGRGTTVPKHAREEIGVGLLNEILKDIRVSRDEFLRLL
ncbi:MAG: type II toxin-antitoxin system HicA family toxin [Thermoplasmatota archaeon]